jgi:hypothetical protein
VIKNSYSRFSACRTVLFVFLSFCYKIKHRFFFFLRNRIADTCVVAAIVSPNGNDVMDLVSVYSHDVCAQNNDDHMPTPSSLVLSFSLSPSFFFLRHQQQQLSKCICGVENKIQHHFFSLLFLLYRPLSIVRSREKENVYTIVVIITISLYNIVSPRE